MDLMFHYDVVLEWFLFGTVNLLLCDHRSVITYNYAAPLKFNLKAMWLFMCTSLG